VAHVLSSTHLAGLLWGCSASDPQTGAAIFQSRDVFIVHLLCADAAAAAAAALGHHD